MLSFGPTVKSVVVVVSFFFSFFPLFFWLFNSFSFLARTSNILTAYCSQFSFGPSVSCPVVAVVVSESLEIGAYLYLYLYLYFLYLVLAAQWCRWSAGQLRLERAGTRFLSLSGGRNRFGETCAPLSSPGPPHLDSSRPEVNPP